MAQDHYSFDYETSFIELFLIFVSACSELTLSSMLAAANTKTIGLTIFNLKQGGSYSYSYAMSTVMVVVIVFLYFVANRPKKGRK